MKHLVTISTRDGFRAVESPALFHTAASHAFAVTPCLKAPGKWAGTHIGTGLAAVTRAGSIRECIASTRSAVDNNEQAFQRALQGLPAAPPPEGLPPAEPRLPEPRIDIEPVVLAIVEVLGECSPEEISGIRSALSRKTGRLKERAPSDPWGKAAWNGLQPNAWKIQFSACFLPPAPAAFLTRLSRHTWPAALDRDLFTLRSLGVA